MKVWILSESYPDDGSDSVESPCAVLSYEPTAADLRDACDWFVQDHEGPCRVEDRDDGAYVVHEWRELYRVCAAGPFDVEGEVVR